MKNPLTSLDELIWKQCEKVTEYAYKNAGWDKWDLIRVTDTAAITAQVGMGIYTAMSGVVRNEFPVLRGYYVLMGGLIGGGGLATSYFYKVMNKQRQDQEFKILTETGASLRPSYGSMRPNALGAASALAGYAAYNLHQDAAPLDVLWGLTMGCASILLISSVASNYFSSQSPPKPPTPKKSLWNIVREVVYKRISGKKPVIVTDPIFQQLDPTYEIQK